jgi:hypothetical protein
MSCRVCFSSNEAGFNAETLIHFRGRNHLANPGVLTFPSMLVCLDCGSTRFRIADAELKLLREGNAPLKAAAHATRPSEPKSDPTGNVLRAPLPRNHSSSACA